MPNRSEPIELGEDALDACVLLGRGGQVVWDDAQVKHTYLTARRENRRAHEPPRVFLST